MRKKTIPMLMLAAVVAATASGCSKDGVSSLPEQTAAEQLTPEQTTPEQSTTTQTTTQTTQTTTTETQSTQSTPSDNSTAENIPTAEAEASTEEIDVPTGEETVRPAPTAEAEPEFPIGCTVSAAWAEDFPEISGNADYIEADTEEYAAQVLFTTDGAVRDFTVLSLSFTDVDENGKLIFDSTVDCEVEMFTADSPLVVNMSFIGEIPNYGISYDNGTGEIQRFTISISGYDGSLILSEF